MAFRMIAAMIAASATSVVYGLDCNAGSTTTYWGDCSSDLGSDTWWVQPCPGSTSCYTYSFQDQFTDVCRYEYTFGGCSIGTGDDTCTTAQATVVSSADGFSCSHCALDGCNSIDPLGRSSGSTRVKAATAGVLGTVAAMVACL
mmetsp:Transcript_35508/g.81292  ORF Transcript_35508/g.81292 Transcript_35508/m.81292 type:complete len:144 (-) Transcript_35508:113-544(-)